MTDVLNNKDKLSAKYEFPELLRKGKLAYLNLTPEIAHAILSEFKPLVKRASDVCDKDLQGKWEDFLKTKLDQKSGLPTYERLKDEFAKKHPDVLQQIRQKRSTLENELESVLAYQEMTQSDFALRRCALNEFFDVLSTVGTLQQEKFSLFELTGVLPSKNDQSKLVQAGEGVRTKQPLFTESAIKNYIHYFEQDNGYKLDDEQKQAVIGMATARSTILSLEGAAGSGKTTTLASLKHALERSGWKIYGSAITHKATNGLQESIKAHKLTIAKLKEIIEQVEAGGKGWGSDKVCLMIDEAGQVSNEDLNNIILRALNLSKARGVDMRVVFAGESAQLKPIKGANGLDFINSLIPEEAKYSLNQIRRQHSDFDKGIVTSLRFGGTEFAVQRLYEAGQIRPFYGDEKGFEFAVNQHIMQLAKQYGEQGRFDEFPLFMASTNRSVKGLNAMISQHLSKYRKPCEAYFLEYYEMPDFMTLYKGEKIVFTHNLDKNIKRMKNGSPVHEDEGRITNGMECILEDSWGEGDECVWQFRFSDDSIATINTSDLIDRKNNQKQWVFSLNYASTIYKSQGTTVDNAVLVCDSEISDSDLYVAASRHRKTFLMFAHMSKKYAQNNKLEIRNTRDIVNALPKYLSRSSDRPTALLSVVKGVANIISQKISGYQGHIFSYGQINSLGALVGKLFNIEPNSFVNVMSSMVGWRSRPMVSKQIKYVTPYSHSFFKENLRYDDLNDKFKSNISEPLFNQLKPYLEVTKLGELVFTRKDENNRYLSRYVWQMNRDVKESKLFDLTSNNHLLSLDIGGRGEGDLPSAAYVFSNVSEMIKYMEKHLADDGQLARFILINDDTTPYSGKSYLEQEYRELHELIAEINKHNPNSIFFESERLWNLLSFTEHSLNADNQEDTYDFLPPDLSAPSLDDAPAYDEEAFLSIPEYEMGEPIYDLGEPLSPFSPPVEGVVNQEFVSQSNELTTPQYEAPDCSSYKYTQAAQQLTEEEDQPFQYSCHVSDAENVVSPVYVEDKPSLQDVVTTVIPILTASQSKENDQTISPILIEDDAQKHPHSEPILFWGNGEYDDWVNLSDEHFSQTQHKDFTPLDWEQESHRSKTYGYLHH